MKLVCSLMVEDSRILGLVLSEQIAALTLRLTLLTTASSRLSWGGIWYSSDLAIQHRILPRGVGSCESLHIWACLMIQTHLIWEAHGFTDECVSPEQTCWDLSGRLYWPATWSWTLGKLQDSLCLRLPHLNNENDYRVAVMIKCESTGKPLRKMPGA